jgi:hypothetical protein
MRSLLKRITLSTALAVALLLSLRMEWSSGSYVEVYTIPEDFIGCVMVIYDVDSAERLVSSSDTIFCNVPRTGIVLTSSEPLYGNKNLVFRYADTAGNFKSIPWVALEHQAIDAVAVYQFSMGKVGANPPIPYASFLVSDSEHRVRLSMQLNDMSPFDYYKGSR